MPLFTVLVSFARRQDGLELSSDAFLGLRIGVERESSFEATVLDRYPHANIYGYVNSSFLPSF